MFDSNEELYFSWWLDELKEFGFVIHWNKNESPIQLTKPVTWDYVQAMKRVPDKVRTQTLIQGSEYTHDFEILFSEKAVGVFLPKFDLTKRLSYVFLPSPIERGNHLALVEIKGNFDQNNMTRLAVNNIKFLYEQQEVFVNLIKIPNLFKETFTPKRYLLTTHTKKARKINFEVKTLEEFLSYVCK